MILDTHGHLEHTLNNWTVRNKIGARQAFIFDNDSMIGDRKLKIEVQNLKEVLKRLTKSEPWFDIMD